MSLTDQVFNFLLNLVQSFSQRAGDENYWVEGSKARPKHFMPAFMSIAAIQVGPLYLAVVLDVCSRRVVGWAMATHLGTQLVPDTLQMAITQRHPEDVIHHSDQSSQYTSLAFGNHCQKAGIIPSMGSVGDCYNNAMCESFFATLECELLDRYTFPTIEEAHRAVFAFIDG